METIESSEARQTSFTRDLFNVARYHLGSRRGFLVIGGVALAAGLAFNWNWLVAAGIAPLLVTALPCLAMCALGLCMNKMGEKSCSTHSDAPEKADDGAATKRTSNL